MFLVLFFFLKVKLTNDKKNQSTAANNTTIANKTATVTLPNCSVVINRFDDTIIKKTNKSNNSFQKGSELNETKIPVIEKIKNETSRNSSMSTSKLNGKFLIINCYDHVS